MISKNKHSPATLYLLNAKNSNKLQQQRKSARVTFSKKKSSRSISQYQKWNPSLNKDTNNNVNQNAGQMYLPSSRTNSQIKKIVLSRNQFGLEQMSLERKLSMIVEIFDGNFNSVPAGKRVNTVAGQQVDRDKGRRSHQNKSDEISLLSVKQGNQKDPQKHSRSRSKISHVRTQSMFTHTDQDNKPSTFQNLTSRMQKRFKSYQKLSQEWRLRYSMQQGDYLIEEMLRIFKTLFNDLVGQFTNHVMGNLQYFQNSITSVAKDYEIQVATLKEEISKKDHVNGIINSLMKTLNQKHYKGLMCSKIFEDIQIKGTNIEHLIQNSDVYEDIIKISKQMQSVKLDTFRVPLTVTDINVSKLDKNNSDDDFYQQERLDHVQNDTDWNNNFQNRQSIKGVLKYIHNHNQKPYEQESNKNNLNSTGYLAFNKSGKNDMRIDNWKSFDDKSINQYKKIKSQR